MKLLSVLALVIATIVANSAAAQSLSPSYVMTSQQIADKFTLDEFKVKRMGELLSSVDPQKTRNLLQEHMNDKTKTVLNYDNKSVFVEYTSPDGRYYDWLPNEEKVVTGTWQTITDNSGSTAVCFTADGTPTATCIPAAYILTEYCTIGLMEKDTFALTSGRIPFQKDLLLVPATPAQ